MFSEAMFNKAYKAQGGHTSDSTFQESLKESLPFLSVLKETYKPKRRFRRTEKLAFASPAAHVQYVLLEYGDQGQTQGTTGAEGAEGEAAAALQALAAAGGIAEGEDDEEELVDEDLVDEEMRKNLQAAGAAGKASKGQVGNLVGMQSDDISRAKAAYDAEQESGDGLQSRLGLADAHKRQVASLEKQIAVYETRAAQLKLLEGELKGDVDGLLGELRQLGADNEQIVSEMEEMEGMETEENRADLARLKSLVILNENLKQQETKFKAQCKKQLGELNEKIATVGDADMDDEEKRKLEQIEQVYAKDFAKFSKVRQLLAKKNQEISFVQRKIDDIPTRTELVQYERRFVELHDQVASKLDETKKHFNTFNNLTDRTEYLEKELNFLDSVHANYSTSMSGSENKSKFLEEVSSVHNDVDNCVNQVEGKLTKAGEERNTLQDEYNALMENQRAYFKACKDFQDECTKNEYLESMRTQGEQAAE